MKRGKMSISRKQASKYAKLHSLSYQRLINTQVRQNEAKSTMRNALRESILWPLTNQK